MVDEHKVALAKLNLTLGDCLGKGVYGVVYKCHMGNGDAYAVKVVNIDERGIPSIMELSIMKSYQHANLSCALDIQIVSPYVYIYQELAVSDLSRVIKTRDLSETEIRQWSNELCQAVNCLHNHGTIHCDIKPDNVLVFDNGSVKLSDFTLSKLKMRKDDRFDYNICALNYRPPEVLASKFWSESVDIWSLACTFYEMITRSMLIPRQVAGKIPTSSDKTIIRKLTLLAIVEWRKTCGDEEAMLERVVGINSCYQVKRISLADTFLAFGQKSDAHRMFTEIILSMLSYEPYRRPSVVNVMRCEYYNECEVKKYTIRGAEVPKSATKERILSTYFSRLPRFDDAVKNMTKTLFLRTVMFDDDLKKIDTCLWMAHKIVNNTIPDHNLCYTSLPQILEMERSILISLGFIVHIIIAAEAENL